MSLQTYPALHAYVNGPEPESILRVSTRRAGACRPPGRFVARVAVGGKKVYLGTFGTAEQARKVSGAARAQVRRGEAVDRRHVRKPGPPAEPSPLRPLSALRDLFGRYSVLPVGTHKIPRVGLAVAPLGDDPRDPHFILLRGEKPSVLIQSPKARKWALSSAPAPVSGPYTVRPSKLGAFGQIDASPAALERIAAVAALVGFEVGVGEAL